MPPRRTLCTTAARRLRSCSNRRDALQGAAMTAAADTASALPDALGPAAREFLSRPAQLLIGDQRLDAADGATFVTLDPSNGREIATVAQAGAEDVQRAVAAARTALEEGPWSS